MNARDPRPAASPAPAAGTADAQEMTPLEHLQHAIDLAERCDTRFALLQVRLARDAAQDVVARRIAALLRASDVVMRADDRAILVLLNGIAGADVSRLADRIAATLATHPTPRLSGGGAIAAIVRYPDDGRDADTLYRAAGGLGG